MTKTYRAAVIGCSRMGGFIDDEVIGRPDFVLPYSHAAGYEAVDRTQVVACADVRAEAMERFGERYGVPKEKQYGDYKDLMRAEKPDIVSIATQPEQRAEIIAFAAVNGVRAIYCEKALCASMAEADAIRDVVKRHGVALNMGTNRRWHPAFEKMRDVVQSGELGNLKAVISYTAGSLFNTASHMFDVLQYVNGDTAPAWIQGYVATDIPLEGDVLPVDPSGTAVIGFANGVLGYALDTPRRTEWEAVCDRGTITARNNGSSLVVRRLQETDHRKWRPLGEDEAVDFTPASPTKRLVEDLVHALDTGEPPRGGVDVARTNMELIFGTIESHRRGGLRLELPLEGSALTLKRH